MFYIPFNASLGYSLEWMNECPFQCIVKQYCRMNECPFQCIVKQYRRMNECPFQRIIRLYQDSNLQKDKIKDD